MYTYVCVYMHIHMCVYICIYIYVYIYITSSDVIAYHVILYYLLNLQFTCCRLHFLVSEGISLEILIYDIPGTYDHMLRLNF